MEHVLILILTDESLSTWIMWNVLYEQIKFFLPAQPAASFSPMGTALRKVFEEQPTRRFFAAPLLS